MGNSETTSSCVRWLFEFCARYLYPESYRFNEHDLLEFERGFAYGYTRSRRNIHLAKFDVKRDIEEIRKEWGIELINIR